MPVALEICGAFCTETKSFIEYLGHCLKTATEDEAPSSTYYRGYLSKFRGGMQVPSWEPSVSRLDYTTG